MRRAGLISNIAQILILVLILPIVFAIIDADTLMNFIQGVPIFDTWTGILYNYATIDTSSLVWIYTKSFFEALIMGICVHTAIGIGNVLQAKGLPILSTFVGIIAGSIIIKLLGVTQGFQIILYIAIMLIGILMMVKGVFTRLKIFNGKSFLMLLIESVLAVIMCGYVVALILFSEGSISIAKLLFVMWASIIALVITYCVGRLVKIDEEKEKKGGFIL